MDAVVWCKNKNPFSQLKKQHHGKYSFPQKGNFPQNRNNKREEHILRIHAERKEMKINGMKQTTNDEKTLNNSDFFFANIKGKTGKCLFLIYAGPLLTGRLSLMKDV